MAAQRAQHKGRAEEQYHVEADPRHEAEGPEHDRHVGYRIEGGLTDLVGRRLARIGDIAGKKEGIAKVELGFLELRARLGVRLVCPQALQRVIGQNAVLHARLGNGDEGQNALHLGIERARGDEAQHPGHINGKVRGLVFHVGEADKRERGRRLVCLPHRFERGELHTLVMGERITALIAQHHDRERTHQAEGGCDCHRALGKAAMAALQQEPGRDRQHEQRAGDIAGRHRVHEFGLRHRIEQDRHEVGDFHAHGFGIELRPHRVLHPAIGDEDPQRGQIGAERHEPGHREVGLLAHPVPAEEEQPDQRRFQEEGHQALDRQRRAEHIAHIVGVVGPVHAELELHRDAGGDAEREIDAEQRAPEFRHVLPDLTAGHHIDALHDGEHEGEAERQGHEQEMVHGCQRELPAR